MRAKLRRDLHLDEVRGGEAEHAPLRRGGAGRPLPRELGRVSRSVCSRAAFTARSNPGPVLASRSARIRGDRGSAACTAARSAPIAARNRRDGACARRHPRARSFDASGATRRMTKPACARENGSGDRNDPRARSTNQDSRGAFLRWAQIHADGTYAFASRTTRPPFHSAIARKRSAQAAEALRSAMPTGPRGVVGKAAHHERGADGAGRIGVGTFIDIAPEVDAGPLGRIGERCAASWHAGRAARRAGRRGPSDSRRGPLRRSWRHRLSRPAGSGRRSSLAGPGRTHRA